MNIIPVHRNDGRSFSSEAKAQTETRKYKDKLKISDKPIDQINKCKCENVG